MSPGGEDRLELLDDSALRRVLAVVAHPDDMEYGGAAAVAVWRSRDVAVSYVLVTRGEAGIGSLPPAESGPVREAEQREACRRVGVDDVSFLGFPDGTVEYGVALRRAIAAEVRRVRPDTVLTGAFRETWPGGMLNQADHIAVGRAVVDATRDAGNRWLFPDLLEAGLEPWGGVRSVLALGSPAATHVVDVTDGFDAGVASLEAHERYLAALGPAAPQPRAMLEDTLGSFGARAGVRYGLPVEVLHLQLF